MRSSLLSQEQTTSEDASRVLTVEIDGPLATQTMNRPEKRNATSDELLDATDGFLWCHLKACTP